MNIDISYTGRVRNKSIEKLPRSRWDKLTILGYSISGLESQPKRYDYCSVVD